MVDPDEPSIRVFALLEGAYVEVAGAAGDQTVSATEPYPVEITPARLLDDLR